MIFYFFILQHFFSIAYGSLPVFSQNPLLSHQIQRVENFPSLIQEIQEAFHFPFLKELFSLPEFTQWDLSKVTREDISLILESESRGQEILKYLKSINLNKPGKLTQLTKSKQEGIKKYRDHLFQLKKQTRFFPFKREDLFNFKKSLYEFYQRPLPSVRVPNLRIARTSAIPSFGKKIMKKEEKEKYFPQERFFILPTQKVFFNSCIPRYAYSPALNHLKWDHIVEGHCLNPHDIRPFPQEMTGIDLIQAMKIVFEKGVPFRDDDQLLGKQTFVPQILFTQKIHFLNPQGELLAQEDCVLVLSVANPEYFPLVDHQDFPLDQGESPSLAYITSFYALCPSKKTQENKFKETLAYNMILKNKP